MITFVLVIYLVLGMTVPHRGGKLGSRLLL